MSSPWLETLVVIVDFAETLVVIVDFAKIRNPAFLFPAHVAFKNASA